MVMQSFKAGVVGGSAEMYLEKGLSDAEYEAGVKTMTSELKRMNADKAVVGSDNDPTTRKVLAAFFRGAYRERMKFENAKPIEVSDEMASRGIAALKTVDAIAGKITEDELATAARRCYSHMETARLCARNQ